MINDRFIRVSAETIRETEKAFQLEVKYWTTVNQPVKKAKMWVPKSCSKVENGKVTEIANFILLQWEDEHRKIIGSYCSYTANRMKIDWNIAFREELLKREAEKEAAYKKEIDDIIAKYLPIVTESSHKFMAELGALAQTFGRIWKEEGTDAATCEEFVNWGKGVNKKYGDMEGFSDYYEKAKNFDDNTRRFVVGCVYDVWVFGDFHTHNYREREEFNKVKDTLYRKHFKKECAIGNEYKAFIEKLYQLNGNRY